MRDTLAKTLFFEGSKNKKIIILVADISPDGKMSEFQKKYPSRFINVGVAEQSMIGMSAGLAMNGFRPFVYTISTFALYRPFEMIRIDLCYQKLPVCIVGMGAGTIYANLGATHLTQEDISIARSIPNLQILCPCDPFELKQAINFCANKAVNPTYLRIGKKGEKNFNFKESEVWQFGKLRRIVKGKNICILTYGPIISKAFEIRDYFKKKIIFEIYSCHTLKPFDEKRLKNIFNKFSKIIIIEDHSEIGGLASIVKINAYKFRYQGKIINFSLKDEFIKCYSSQNDLLERHGLSNIKIIKKIKKII
jgi:transketolase